MQTISPSLVALVGSITLATAVSAASLQGNPGYVTDSQGQVAVDSSGNCVLTNQWTPELAIDDCRSAAPMVQNQPEPEPEPEVAETEVDNGEIQMEASLPMVEPEPMVEEVPAEPMVLSAGVLFPPDSSTLNGKNIAELDDLANKINRSRTIQGIEVIGHTDSRGEVGPNQRLSEKRAEAVKAYLVSRGVDAYRITTIGMGESQPIATNMYMAGRAKNRRVEIRFITR